MPDDNQELLWCVVCDRDYIAEPNTTTDCCCPECLHALERSPGYEGATAAT